MLVIKLNLRIMPINITVRFQKHWQSKTKDINQKLFVYRRTDVLGESSIPPKHLKKIGGRGYNNILMYNLDYLESMVSLKYDAIYIQNQLCNQATEVIKLKCSYTGVTSFGNLSLSRVSGITLSIIALVIGVIFSTRAFSHVNAHLPVFIPDSIKYK